MSFLYLTADSIGTPTGGGAVTFNELRALQTLGNVDVLSRDDISFNPGDPFDQDRKFKALIQHKYHPERLPKLMHCYSGCLTETVKMMKEHGVTVTYTAAAHSIEESKKEHESLGLEFNYPHLTDPELWRKYVGGYLCADALIVPSTHSERIMRSFGANRRTVVIPHGCDLPAISEPAYPNIFTLGYLGAIGPDKGLRYLLEAWKCLAYKDAVLVIAGRDSTSPFMRHMIERFGGGNIVLQGWIKNVSDFYNNITAYCQPSCSEGFGIEIVEAMAHYRPVICSAGAGAFDLVYSRGMWFPERDVEELMTCIEHYRQFPGEVKHDGKHNREVAEQHTWEKIRQQYVDFWKGLLS